MTTSSFNFASMAAQLAHEQGVTFQDKARTWDTAEDVKEVVDALNGQTTVHYLNLDGNTLGVDAAKAIGVALQRHPEFRKALWKNLFTRRLKSEIPEALKHLGAGLIEAKAKLTVLDLSDNALGPNGMLGLEEFLRSPVCYSLQELRLYNCGLGPEGGAMLSRALIDLHDNARKAGTPLQLRVFVGARNRLENAGAQKMAEAFATLKTLEEIVLMQNSIFYEGIEALAESFKSNVHLRVLNLNDNILRPKGAAKIVEVLPHVPMLREINMGDCLIKTNGAYHIGDGLEQGNDLLETIDLSHNEINSDGGLYLVGALKNKAKLKDLNLDGNSFGKEGCKQVIAEMAKTQNPKALGSLEEDVSEDEDDHDDDDEEDDDDEDDDGQDYQEGDYDEEEEHDHGNDTTEEADEDEEDYAEQTAYVTTKGYHSQIFNDTTKTQLGDTFASDNNNKTAISQTCTPADFVLSQKPCTKAQFDSMDATNKLSALHGIINQFTEDNHLLLLVFTTLKCAHLSQSSKAALDLAVSLYQATFEYAIKTQQETRVLNYVLKQLELIPHEVPFKSPYDVKSCRYALNEAVKGPQFANAHIKDTFTKFLKN